MSDIYQEAGIRIKHTFGNEEARDITVTKPSQFKSLFYRFKAIMSLSRNTAGGFGVLIPYKESRHYGYG